MHCVSLKHSISNSFRRVHRRRLPRRSASAVYPNVDVVPFSRQLPSPKLPLRILLISNDFQSLTQQHWLFLRLQGHNVIFEVSGGSRRQEELRKKYEFWKPNITICPFLTSPIPETMYRHPSGNHVVIHHPGPRGHRGASAIDECLLRGEKEFGNTFLLADKEMDAGPVISHTKYRVPSGESKCTHRTLTKNGLYRHECTMSSLLGLSQCIENYQNFLPHQSWSHGSLPPLRNPMKQSDCSIDWDNTEAKEVVRIIRSRDGFPGVLDSTIIPGQSVFMYGAHLEHGDVPSKLKASPGTIVAFRDETVLIATASDTFIWVSHLKLHGGKATECARHEKHFKLPAMMVLPQSIRSKLVEFPPTHQSFGAPSTSWRDVWYQRDPRDRSICNLYFDFYNGAMSTSQCRKLEAALKEIQGIDVQTVVLLGGSDSFSNGIHLNVIESSPNSAQESWDNINAMNDVVLQILKMRYTHIMVTLFRSNAGAGGVMLGLASEIVMAYSTAVLNPHYAGMNLHGSEYFSLTLPTRVGEEMARRLMTDQLPVSATHAKEIGLIDHIVQDEWIQNSVGTHHGHSSLSDVLQTEIPRMQRIRSVNPPVLTPDILESWQSARQRELSIMIENFHDPNYHTARKNFVHKVPRDVTPWAIQKINALTAGHAALIDGKMLAQDFKASFLSRKKASVNGTIPCLGVIVVGNHGDSAVFIREKQKAALEVGIEFRLARFPPSATQNEITKQIHEWNADDSVHGILLQLPLPPPSESSPNNVNSRFISSQISLSKDVDGLRWDIPGSQFQPCAVAAVLHILKQYDVKVRGLSVVVLGSSHLLGLPLAQQLNKQFAMTMVCDRHTPLEVVQQCLDRGDVVISAVGHPGLVKRVKQGACVVDAGIMVIPSQDSPIHKESKDDKVKSSQSIRGDVDRELVFKQASLMSPVPGGVGPVTVAILLQHVFQAFDRQQKTQQMAHT